MLIFAALFAVGSQWTHQVTYKAKFDDGGTLSEIEELRWKVVSRDKDSFGVSRKRVPIGTQIGSDRIPPSQPIASEDSRWRVDARGTAQTEQVSTDEDARRLDRILIALTGGPLNLEADREPRFQITLVRQAPSGQLRAPQIPDRFEIRYQEQNGTQLDGWAALSIPQRIVTELSLRSKPMRLPGGDVPAIREIEVKLTTSLPASPK